MTGETDNLPPEGGTDNAQLSEHDTPETWDYFDPDEDNEEIQQEEGTEDEADEVETDDEAEAPEDEDQEADDQQEDEAKSAVVKLADGTEVTHDELIQGYHRQADYTRKMQEVSNLRKSNSETSQRLKSISDALVEHLVNLVPPEPDTSLALTDPSRYTGLKAQHDAALAQVQKIVEVGGQSAEVSKSMSDDEFRSFKAQEQQKLIAAIPSTGTAEGKAKFLAEATEAAKHVGFSDEDVGQVLDHRVYLLAHWAKKGMDADKAKKAVREKAQKAAPAQPRKPGQAAKQANSNVKAMQKLARTGSIHDALAVDFD